MEGCRIRRGREQPRPRLLSGCWWHAVLTTSGEALEPRAGSSRTSAPPALQAGPAPAHPPLRGLVPHQRALCPAGRSRTGALEIVLSVPPAAFSGSASLLSRLGYRVSSTDTALRWWEQTFLLRSGCIVLPAPRAHAGVLARASLHGAPATPVLPCGPAAPRASLMPWPWDKVRAPKSDVFIRLPLLRACFLVLSSEHFSELAISLFLSFHLSGPQSHPVVMAEPWAVACLRARPFMPSLPFEDRAGV